MIAKILREDKVDLERLYENISIHFPIKNGTVSLAHKTLYDWLINSDFSGKFCVSQDKGNGHIFKYLYNEYNEFIEADIGKYSEEEYALKYWITHAAGATNLEIGGESALKFAKQGLLSKKLYGNRKKAYGNEKALEYYFNDLNVFLKKANRRNVIDVLGSEFFVSEIFNKNIESLYYSGTISLLEQIGFEEILKNGKKDDIGYILALAYFYDFTKNFEKTETAEKILEKIFDLWIKDENSKIFILQGLLGTGKTYFIVNHCLKHFKEIAGVHFCKYDNKDRKDARKIIMSLAYFLATEIPEYAEALVNSEDLPRVEEKGIKDLFKILFVTPLSKIEKQETKVLIIDALNEIEEEREELIDVIVNEFEKTPKWLKLFVSARPGLEIEKKLLDTKVLFVDKYYLNGKSIDEYLKSKLDEYTEEGLVKLEEKCGGFFLPAVVAVQERLNKKI